MMLTLQDSAMTQTPMDHCRVAHPGRPGRNASQSYLSMTKWKLVTIRPPSAFATRITVWICSWQPSAIGMSCPMWGLCPHTPEIYRIRAKMADFIGGGSGRPLSHFGTESALELRLRSALSSAQIRAVYCESCKPGSETMSVRRTSQAKGSLKNNCECSNRKLSQWRGSPH